MTRPIRCGPAACVMIVMPSGISMPPPSPCSTRKPISDWISHAKLHNTEPLTNSTSAVMNSRLVPNRSAPQPVSGMTVASDNVYAVIVQAAMA